MARPSKTGIPEVFDVRIKVDGFRGAELYKIVEGKRKREHRKTLPETIAAIILDSVIKKSTSTKK